MKEKKILFNYLPPGRKNFPSPAMSILSNFIKNEGFESEIIYWNLIFGPLMKEYSQEGIANSDFIEMYPFYALLSEKYDDKLTEIRLIQKLQLERPFLKALDTNSYNAFFTEVKSKAKELMRSTLVKYNLEDVLLFAVSSKFNQWIPAILLIKELKKINRDIQIVIGGFSNQEQAVEIMKINKDFDFAIWGEGEYPLLELCNLLKNGSDNFNNVERLIYRKDNELQISETISKTFLDFNNYKFPTNYDSYIKEATKTLEKKSLRFTIDSSRGCSWNGCKFCTLNTEYKYRRRSLENIVEEIDFISLKYGIYNFHFLDNDFIGLDVNRFEKLLDLLINLTIKNDSSYVYFAEVIPISLNSNLLKKMSLAGFVHVQVGYESLSDSLLKKMNKKSRFANNILYIKLGIKYGMPSLVMNVIRGIPNETEKEVFESIDNLHFLRFFFKIGLNHVYSDMLLMHNTNFSNQVDEKEKINWNRNQTVPLLPQKMLVQTQLNIIFPFRRHLIHKTAWNEFDRIKRFYDKSEFSYKLIKNNGIYHYYEYLKDVRVKNITFDKPEYIYVLKYANNQVISFDELYSKLKSDFPGIDKEKTMEIMKELRNEYLLYYSECLSTIVSIIDTSVCD